MNTATTGATPTLSRRFDRAPKWAGWALLGLPGVVTLLLACVASGQFANQKYHRGKVSYRVGPLPALWQRLQFRGADVVFRSSTGGTIAISGQCPGNEDVPLDVLTNHLLFGIANHQEPSRSLFTLDSRQALRTHLRGELDGVPIELELVVLKKDGCTYDLQLIAGPQHFASCLRDFEAFVQGFTTTGAAQSASER